MIPVIVEALHEANAALNHPPGEQRVPGERWLGRIVDTVLRDSMDFDHLKSPALYFGTTTGQLWIGRDGGEQWSCLFDALPPINCVKIAVV